MRLLFAFCYALGLCVAPIRDLNARDSATLAERTTVGFSLPSANRAQFAARAERANQADFAETARHILEPVSGTPTPTTGETGIVCGLAAAKCGWQVRLDPGTYVVRCGSHPHDSTFHQTTVVITGTAGGGARWAGCPGPTVGRLGISNRYLQWISRVG